MTRSRFETSPKFAHNFSIWSLAGASRCSQLRVGALGPAAAVSSPADRASADVERRPGGKEGGRAGGKANSRFAMAKAGLSLHTCKL